MSGFQNPNSEQIPYPISSNPYPNPRAAPTPTPTPPISKVLTFDDVSKFFSSSLSDAADSLGVCTSVVRRICHENGLESWPYRKVRAGKSIEEIKREAARVKDKRVKDFPSAARQINVPTTKAVPSSYLTSQAENKSASSMQTILKPPSVLQQGTNKNPSPPTGNNTQKSQVSNFPGGASTDLDEFKYGFPSEGLASVSFKWWGSSDSNTDTKTNIQNGGKEVVTGKNETTKNSNLDHAEEEGLLSGLRKRAVKEGEEALKLGIHRKYNLKKLNSKKKTVLVQIFKSSLPSQWIDE